MRRLLGLLGLLGLLVVITMGACDRQSDSVGQTASARLSPQVQQIRTAVASGDREGAAAKLAEIRQTVAELRQQNELTQAGAAKVLAAVAEVETQLGGTAPSQTFHVPTTSPPPTQARTPPTVDNREPNGGKGRGKGEGGKD